MYRKNLLKKKRDCPKGCLSLPPANDKAVEALGSGLVEQNAGLVSLGTYITSMVFGNKNRTAAGELLDESLLYSLPLPL